MLKNSPEQGPRQPVHPVLPSRPPRRTSSARTASGRSSTRLAGEARSRTSRCGPARSRSTTRRSAATPPRRSDWFAPERTDVRRSSHAVGGPVQLSATPGSAARGERTHHRAAEREGRDGPLPRLRLDLPARHRRPADRGARSGSRSTTGWSGFWQARLDPGSGRRAEAHPRRGPLAALTNAVLGTITAWVLVRDEFRGKSLLNAVIDLPFALPTIVAGLVAAHVLRPPLARRHPPRLHARRALPRAAASSRCRSSSGRCNRSCSSSTRRWRRRRARSAPASSRSSGGSCCRTSCPGSSPG